MSSDVTISALNRKIETEDKNNNNEVERREGKLGGVGKKVMKGVRQLIFNL